MENNMTDQAAPELLPCPFCGSFGIDKEVSRLRPYPYCTNCGAQGPSRKVDWNHRADLAAPSAAQVCDLESGETRTLAVTAVWKPCVHGGGWWLAKDADGRDVILSSDTLQTAPSAPAEVGETWLERWRHLPYPNSHKMVSHPDGAWVRHHEAAERLTAMRAENERLRKDRDEWQKSWREVLSAGYEMKARAERAEDERDELRTDAQFLVDRLAGVDGYSLVEDDARDWYGHVSPAITRLGASLADHAKLKGEV